MELVYALGEWRSNQSGSQWASVYEADFNSQDAEVVCWEIGCGAPSDLRGGGVKVRVQPGLQSSSVKVMSLFSCSVALQPEKNTPVYLTILLPRPAHSLMM